MPEQKPRLVTGSDRDAWASYARQVKPLPGRPVPAYDTPQTPPQPKPAAGPRATYAPATALRGERLVIGEPTGGLDKATWQRLRRGTLAPARTLDLHGYTAQRAFHALHTLLLTAHAEQLRCVEVITGRGSGEGGGVIRRELPLWLNLPSLRPLVLAAVHPHPANPGATRILLKRTRK
jgi:DNA-nicking Smr family endonuclease